MAFHPRLVVNGEGDCVAKRLRLATFSAENRGQFLPGAARSVVLIWV